MNPAFALILASLAVGYAVRRLGAMPKDAADTFNRFVIYVCVPAVVLRLVPRLTWQPGLAVLVVTPWVILAVVGVAVAAAARAAGWPRGVQGALLLCVPLGNTSFLGFPMIAALLGEDAVRYAVLYDQLGSFLILATYGLFVVARFSGAGDPSARAILSRVVRFPPFVALLVALLPVAHPPVLTKVLEGLGEPLVPLAMFAVGLKLELRLPKHGSALALGLVAKMALSPLLALGIAHALGAPRMVLRAAVLESAMPPMITAGAFAILSGFAPELAAALVGYGIIGALVTLPLWARLVPS